MMNVLNFKQTEDGNLTPSDSLENTDVYKKDFRSTVLSIKKIEIIKWHSLYSYDPFSKEEMPLEYEDDSGIRIEGEVDRDAPSSGEFYYLNEDENNKDYLSVEKLNKIKVIIDAPKDKAHLYGYFNRNIRIITETLDTPYFYLSLTKKQFESLVDDLKNNNNLSLSVHIYFSSYITDADLDTQIYTDSSIPEDFLIKQHESCAISSISVTSKKGAHYRRSDNLAIGEKSNNQLILLLKGLLVILLVITILIAYKF